MTEDRNATHPLLGKKLGPYRIESVLGEGGMGTVFRATVRSSVHGLRRGTRVAVKTIREHLLDNEDSLSRFEREGRLGIAIDHPNVVRTYEVGTRRVRFRKVRLLVMEYVEGQTLAELLEELGSVPEELCRHVGREMAKGLAAIHAVGAMHRDIKPSNVLITPEHVVKLMDLGLARTDEEDVQLSATGAFVGSLAYASPEQMLKGSREVDARVDLWSTGVSLYELNSGVQPFMADTSGRVIQNVVRAQPRRLGEIQPQVSPFLEEVIHGLLVADPDQRLASAEELAGILAATEQSSWWRAREQLLRSQTHKPIRRVRIPRETDIYGREDELAVLRSCYERARAGDGNLLLIEGETGIGKTRVIDEFLAGLERDGEDVNALIGSYPPGGAATAARGFSTAYREHFGEQGLEQILASHLTVTPALVPAFAALLRGDVAPPGSEPLDKESVQTVFVHTTRSLAAARPTILWIDDLHFAPEEGRGLLSALALAAPGHRILLIATARPGLAAEWLTDLDRLDQTRRLELSRLTPDQLEQLLADALESADAAAEIAPQIATTSDGNPFFAFEILKELRLQGVLRKTEQGTWRRTSALGEIEIPSTVLDLIEARLADLTEEERSLLEVAACIGFRFDPLLVGSVVGMQRIPLLKCLAQIERKHRLVRSVGRRLVFDQHQIQEALHAQLSELMRESYHAAIAEAMETREGAAGKDPLEIDGALAHGLCEHFLLGAQGGRALRYLGAALDHVQSGHRYDAAVALAERALGVKDLIAGADRVALLLRVAGWLEHLGRRGDERTILDQALGLADALEVPGPGTRVRERLGFHLTSTAHYDAALAMLEEAQGRAERDGDDLLLARATIAAGATLLRCGRIEEARAEFERAIPLFEGGEDSAGMAKAVGNLGVVLWHLGQRDRAMECMRRRLSIAREQGDRRGEAAATGNLGAALMTMGLRSEARAQLEQAFEISREIGHRQGEGSAAGNLASCLMVEGRLGASRARTLRALEIARETGDRRSEAIALVHLGAQLSLSGSFQEAGECLDQAVSLARAIGAKRELGYALGSSGTNSMRRGDQDAARAILTEAAEGARAIEEAGSLTTSLLGLAGLARDRGDDAGAREHVFNALEASAGAGTPEPRVLALAHRAAFAGGEGDAEAAAEALAESEDRMGWAAAMEARFVLFQATDDAEHLSEAHRRLMFLRDHAGADHRASILQEVPLHRAIAQAWETASP